MDDYNEWKARWHYLVMSLVAPISLADIEELLRVREAMDEAFDKRYRHDLRLVLKDIEEP